MLPTLELATKDGELKSTKDGQPDGYAARTDFLFASE